MIPEKVRRVLDRYGLAALEFEEGSTPTALLAAQKIGVATGQIAKSILMRGKNGSFCLVVAPGDRKISTAKLKAVIGVKARMAAPEEILEVTGFAVGGVCPFGLDGIEIILDEGLKVYDTVYPAAGTSASGVPVSPLRLAEITGGKFRDVTAASAP